MAKKRNLKMWVVMSVFLVGMASAIAAGGTIYVDADASPGGDGTNWGTAYKYLQDALYKPPTSGDEIWVAEGTYNPDANSADPNGSGDRTATLQLINSVAIYGGFAGGESSLDERDWQTYEAILSGDINTPGDNSDNSYHVVTAYRTDETAVLDGFTITAGTADGPWQQDYDIGAGMYSRSGSPTVINATFNDNSAVTGGGIYNTHNLVLTNCAFINNYAQYEGGAMHNEDGGFCNPALTNCVFIGNSTGDTGGAIYNDFGVVLTLTNCIFTGNSGAVIDNDEWCDALAINCTFSANLGTVLYNLNSDSSLTNCILWDNPLPQIINDSGSWTHITYSCIQGGWAAGWGNIDEDPVFIDANGLDGIPGTADDEEGYVHLRGYSPCINAGDLAGDYSGQVDLDGQPRVAYGRVDMGADEVFPAAGDFEPDGDVDFVDFAIFAGNWLLGF